MTALFLLKITNNLDAHGTDLEKRSNSFVIETTQLIIPGYPNAFNPSIVSWRGSLILSFRELPFPTLKLPRPIQSASVSHIGLVFLNDDLTLDGAPYILDLPGVKNDSEVLARAEDARLINIDERLYIVYSDNRDEVVTEGGFRMYIGELDFDGTEFTLKKLEALTNFPESSPHRREKNWVPFDYKGNLLLAYSLLPHKILRPLLDGSEECELWSTTRSPLSWKWGELRGGTPALRNGNEYLAFFHSSIDVATIHSHEKVIPHYFIGAYTFQKDPPFAITKISPEPIIGKNFYHGKEYPYYWKPVQVVFPCGYVFYDEHILLTYGRQDHEVWVAKIDKKELLSSLIHVNNIISNN